MSKKPMRVVVTGAAGQIGYSLLFRIAAGEMLGSDQPVILQLVDIPPAMKAVSGVMMELEDCAFPLLAGMEASDDPATGFKDTDVALLVGARPRSKGMLRKDLLEANGAIFTGQGKALSDAASRDVKVLVVGNPANTNGYIAMKNAPDLDSSCLTAMVRLDQNRAMSQVATKTGRPVTDVKKVTIWGNHSATQYPDITHATVAGKPATELVDQGWIAEQFIPRVQKRGAEVIAARGHSSAASAAYAGLSHMRDWVAGSPEGDWLSMAVPSDGSYGIPEGLMYSFPVTVSGGRYSIVQDLAIDDFSRAKMDATMAELEAERDAVKDLI